LLLRESRLSFRGLCPSFRSTCHGLGLFTAIIGTNWRFTERDLDGVVYVEAKNQSNGITVYVDRDKFIGITVYMDNRVVK
jgi:hypothetical protein